MNDDEGRSRLNLPDPGIALLADVITCTDVDPQIRDYAIDHPSISDAEPRWSVAMAQSKPRRGRDDSDDRVAGHVGGRATPSPRGHAALTQQDSRGLPTTLTTEMRPQAMPNTPWFGLRPHP